MRWRLRDALEPRRTVDARGVRFAMRCGNWITQFRVDSFEAKEPETLDWVDSQIHDGDVFFDVGGNVGVYTVYAALRHPGSTVVVFEPEYANLHLLRDNVIANRLADRVMVYPIALSDRTGVSRLHVQDLTPGAALHTESPNPMTRTEAGERVVLVEGAWSMTLDEFCAQTGRWPNALKIDVDGAEARVLAGAVHTLARSELRSLLIEGGETGLAAGPRTLLRQAGFRAVELSQPSAAGNEVWVR